MELKPRKEGDRKKYIANCDPCGISLHASSLGKLRQKWKEMGGKVEWVREEPINLKENSNSKDQSR
jgi:hypothetical protein